MRRTGLLRRSTANPPRSNLHRDASELGVQRYLIICLEAQSIPVAVKAMRPPIGMDTEADARSVVATPAALGTALR